LIHIWKLLKSDASWFVEKNNILSGNTNSDA